MCFSSKTHILSLTSKELREVLGKIDEALKYFGKTALFVIVLWNNVWACKLSCFSHVRICATLCTITCQVPLSMGFSREEYWSRLPCPPPGKSSQGSNPHLLCLLQWQAGSLPLPLTYEAP